MLQARELLNGNGLYIGDGREYVSLHGVQDLINLDTSRSGTFIQMLDDVPYSTIDYAIAIRAFAGKVHNTFELFETLSRILHRGSILYMYANKATPKLFNSNKVTERDPRGGFTILNDTHVHYFTEYELELHLTDFDIERMRPVNLVIGNTKYLQWEIVASR